MSGLYSIGQMNEHADALERNGWTPADVKKASGGDILSHLLPLVRAYGEAVVAPTPYFINCDEKPFEPDGLTVAHDSDQLPNRVRGQFAFDPTKIRLHLSKNQQGGKRIKGTLLKNELAGEPVLSANVLDFYLANSHLIPNEWKGKVVFFWGTIYRDAYGNLYVRCLDFRGGGWRSYYGWLGSGWGGYDPSAVRAS